MTAKRVRFSRDKSSSRAQEVSPESAAVARRSPSSPGAPGRTHTILPPLLVFLIAMLTLGVSVGNGFTNWDDNVTIHQNPRFNPPTLRGVAWYWGHAEGALYVPVTYTVWGLLAAASGSNQADASGWRLNPSAFHAASLIAHCASALAAYAILRLLVHRPWAAFSGAVLFAVHPLQVEAVDWASGLKDVLAGMFSLVALWQYLLFISADDPSFPGDRSKNPRARDALSRNALSRDALSRDALSHDALSHDALSHDALSRDAFGRDAPAHYALAAAALLLAVLSKPSAVATPLLALVLDVWGVGRSIRRAIRPAAGLALLVLPLAVVARLAQASLMTPVTPLWQRPLVAADALAFYLYKLAWPVHLSADYGRRPAVAAAHGWLYWTWVVPVAAALLVASMRKSRPWLAAAGLVFALAPAPVLGLTRFDFQFFTTVADHYVYVAMLGPALALAGWLSERRAICLNIAVGLVLAALAVRSALQTSYWQNDVLLWSHAEQVSPDSFAAHNNLGAAIEGRDRDAAINEYQTAVDMNPRFIGGHDNLASALIQRGDKDRSLEHMLATLRIQDELSVPLNDNMVDSRIKLGWYLLTTRRRSEAAKLFRQVLLARPDNVAAIQGLRAAIAPAEATRP